MKQSTQIFSILPILVLFISFCRVRGLGVPSFQFRENEEGSSLIGKNQDTLNSVIDSNSQVLFGQKRVTRSVNEDEMEDLLETKEGSFVSTVLPLPKVHNKITNSESDIDLPAEYNIYQIPKHMDQAALPVFVNIVVIKILDFDEQNEVLKLDIEFKVMWTDYKILFYNNTRMDIPRTTDIPLIFNLTDSQVKVQRRTLKNPQIIDKIWKPNLLIENLLGVGEPVVMGRSQIMKHISKIGWFEYITRITLKLNCGMDFRYYPADTQSCQFMIRESSDNKNLLNLQWFKNGVFLEEIEISNFNTQIDLVWTLDTVKRQEPDDVFRALAFKFAARRKLSYHLVQTYLASTFYIVITCLSFLLPTRMVEARIGISMTTLLTLTVMFSSVRESTPVTSYTKAIDIWMVSCIFFVFLTLAQFTFTIWLKNATEEVEEDEEKRIEEFEQQRRRVRRSNHVYKIAEGINNNVRGRKGTPLQIHHYKQQIAHVKSLKTFQKYEKIVSVIDSYSFPIFLAIFTIYTICYWSWLLTRAHYFTWKLNSTLNNIKFGD